MFKKIKDSFAVFNEDRKLKRLHSKSWKQLNARYQSLLYTWKKYESDLALIIDYPIMIDHTDPFVRKVVEALQNVQTTAELPDEDPRTMYAEESKAYAAVHEFEAALAAAEKHARHYGQTKLSERKQEKLANARRELNIVLQGSAPSEQLEAAYKNLRVSLDGTIDVPEQALRNVKYKLEREIASRDISYLPA